MKTLFTCVVLTFSTICFSQQMKIAFLAEQTVGGPQYGMATGWETKNLFGLTAFYQIDAKVPVEGGEKNTFYGAQLQLPISKSDKLAFFGTLRGGLVNDKFAVVVPGLETRLNVTKRIALAFGMSIRMNYPSLSGKAIFKFF